MSKTTKINKEAIVSVKIWKEEKSKWLFIDSPAKKIFFNLITIIPARYGFRYRFDGLFSESGEERWISEKDLDHYGLKNYRYGVYNKCRVNINMSNDTIFEKFFDSDGECDNWLSTNLEGVNLIEM